MLNNFRDHHPMGSIITELLRIEEGIHFVRAQVVVNSTILGTGIAGSHTVEDAEDAALKRALIHAGFSRTSHTGSALGAWNSPGYATGYDDLPSEVAFDSSSGHGSSGHGSSGYGSSDYGSSGLAGNGHRPNQPPSWDPIATPAPPPSSAPLSSARGSGELMDEEDLSDVIAQTDVEMKRVGWTPNQGRDYLVKTFGKRSRQLLEPHELMQFLRHLQQQTTRS